MSAQSVEDRFAFDFIDPLFAIVFHISLVEGIMHQDWFKDPSLIVEDEAAAFELFVLALGYLFVIVSWVGYHLSIISSPLNPNHLAGFVRFIIDVLLLFMYWLLLLKFEEPQFVILLLAIVFALYVPWDRLKKREWPSKDKPARRGVTIVWAVLFGVLALVYWVGSPGDENPTAVDWLAFVVAFVMVIGYRAHKNWPRPKAVLESIAWP